MVEFSSLEGEFDDKKLKQLSRKASSFSKQSSSYNHVADSTRKMEKMRQRRTSATVQKIMGWYPTATSTEQHAEKEDIESPLELLTERVAVLADELPPESPNEKRRSPSSLRRSSTVRKAPSVRRTTTIRRKSTRLGMFQHIEQVEQQDKEEQHVDDYLKAHRRAQRLIPCTIKVQACWRMKVRFRIYEKYKHRKIFKRNTVFRIWRLSYLARRLSRRALSRTIWRLWTREVDVAKTLRLFEFSTIYDIRSYTISC